MLAGLTTRWKQAVAYHFTSASFDAQQVKECIFEVIRRAEAAGITVNAVVTDMGPGNTAIWRLCGIHASKYGKTQTSCPHPCGNGRRLHFLADSSHLLKNLRGHLVRGQEIILDKVTVARHKLPTNKVSLEHVRQACAIDENHKLKLMPHLKTRDLDPNHYEKMNVATAHSLMHHSTAAALRYLVGKALLPNTALTTAFFIDQVFFWFTIMTSRTRKTALSDLCPQKADDAKQLLQDFIALFTGLMIVDKTGKGTWKPVQTGAVLSTVAALSLRECYITKQGFKFLMLSRLSQDALENLFSSIRFKTPVPRAREFKSTFRVIVLAQFSQPSRSGSYSIDDSQDLVLFLRDSGLNADPKEDANEVVDVDDGIFELCQEEQDSLEYFSGYIAYAVIHKHKLCQTCHLSIVDRSREVPELLALKCYARNGRNPLKVPSQPLVRLMQACENLFRANETNLLNSKCSVKSLKQTVLERADLYQEFPTCHSVAQKALSHFFLCRLRFALKQRNV
ncbi:transposable element P transposase [Dermacentor silvarum]|uniref:transposable element P transposase n=1 Tax=Dermacentor silvarum TaxID=543639 RepID=UPI002100F3E9|nr:transposable element P transposase [Dermacentor silvarum]